MGRKTQEISVVQLYCPGTPKIHGIRKYINSLGDDCEFFTSAGISQLYTGATVNGEWVPSVDYLALVNPEREAEIIEALSGDILIGYVSRALLIPGNLSTVVSKKNRR